MKDREALNFKAGGLAGATLPIIGGASKGGGDSVYNTTHINISGNVDQRSIDQIRGVIAASPKQVEGASTQGKRNISGLRRPKGR